jgi:hypothetical protein
MVLPSHKAKINRVKAALPGLLLDFKTTRHRGDKPLTSPATPARHHESLADCCSATVPDLRGEFHLGLRQAANHRRRRPNSTPESADSTPNNNWTGGGDEHPTPHDRVS